MSKNKQNEFENWINDQKIILKICSERERNFLKRIYERNQKGKDYTPKQKDVLKDLQAKSHPIIKNKKKGIITNGNNRFRELFGDYSEIREPFAKIPKVIPEKEGEYIWEHYIKNSKGEQSWYFTDNEGTWYITLEQNAIATESNYDSDISLWVRKDTGLRFRKYKDLDRYIFLEGKDKDYFYMDRSDLPPIPSIRSEIILTEMPQKRHTGGRKILILTLSGAVKFNFRKRKESALKTADALVERDRDFIRAEKVKLLNLKKEYKHKLKEVDERESIPLDIDKYNNLEHFIKCRDKFEREFILHSRDGERFKEKYVKEHNGVWKGWYNTYTRSPEFRTPSLMTWKFFTELYHENVLCFRCGKKINNFNDYSPHHEELEFKDDHLWHVFLEGDQKIEPSHTKKCHQKGNSKFWDKND